MQARVTFATALGSTSTRGPLVPLLPCCGNASCVSNECFDTVVGCVVLRLYLGRLEEVLADLGNIAGLRQFLQHFRAAAAKSVCWERLLFQHKAR